MRGMGSNMVGGSTVVDNMAEGSMVGDKVVGSMFGDVAEGVVVVVDKAESRQEYKSFVLAGFAWEKDTEVT